jgi:hypothetical protein
MQCATIDPRVQAYGEQAVWCAAIRLSPSVERASQR